ncbi:MAG: hypothetical protein H9872_06385 [Candidatus Cellulosilyticum pullistercoris]|uniref:Uncharacterized protein n=1 Tax=Candidatus Cellulosilyticum pullistercoris TaxID=2838521 RepID=A0A9E2NL45_9FIRM|nr:hypothetical protein [Candidatus Cellulosilyticum pullistercoris]
MAKRDYKSYNILGEELPQEDVYEENRYTEVQPIDIEPINEEQNKEESISQPRFLETSQEIVEVVKIEKEQKTFEDETADINKDIARNAESNKKDKIKNVNTGTKQEEVDMTFLGYKNYYQTKERSTLVKWSIRLAKLILLIMLLPLIAIIGTSILACVGGFLTVIAISVGTGVVILGTICFISTQVDASLIALGISSSVTAISFGGILLVLFCMLIKWMIGLFKKYRKPRNQSMKKEER